MSFEISKNGIIQNQMEYVASIMHNSEYFPSENYVKASQVSDDGTKTWELLFLVKYSILHFQGSFHPIRDEAAVYTDLEKQLIDLNQGVSSYRYSPQVNIFLPLNIEKEILHAAVKLFWKLK